MRNFYTACVFILVSVLSVTGLFAQTPQYFTTGGTSSNSFPFSSTSSNKVQWLYTPTDFSATPISGNIDKVYIKSSTAQSPTYSNLTIKIGYTTLSTFPAGTSNFETGLTEVYYAASKSITSGVDTWIEFSPLTGTFYYDGVQNIVVEASQTGYTGSGFSVRQNTNGGNLRLFGGVASATGSSGTGQLNFGFDLVPAGPCTSPPLPGSAAATPDTVCANVPFQLSVTGHSQGTGQTYQWQTSVSATGPWTNVGPSSAISAFTTSASTTSWYRVAVTCNSTTDYSAPVEVLINPAFPGGTYTIDGGVATGGTNFQSFTDAVNAISCGITGPVTFNVAPGTYNEQVTIPDVPGASAVNTIVFNGNLATLTFNSANTSARAGIHLNGADHITLDSLIIDGSAGTYAYGVVLTNQADSNTISNCTIINNTTATSTNYIGIMINGSATTSGTSGNNGNGNRILNNTINGGYYGIYLYGNSASSTQNNNNVVSGNLVKDFYLYGIYSIYQSAGLVISKNELTRPLRNYATATTAYAIYVATSTVGSLVEKNRIHNMFDAMTTTAGTFYGIYFTTDATVSNPNIVANNLIYNVGGNAVVYGIASVGSDHMKIYHNTIALDDQASTTGNTFGLYQSTAATGVDFRNNIVFISRSGSGSKRAIWFNTTTSTIVSNNNVLVITSTGGTSNVIGQFGTTNYNTLTDWKTANANAYDQSSLSIDPLFVNPSAGEYKPTEALLNNTGVNVGITTDILDSVRNVTNPDPGAYEFSGPPCINPANAGNATASVTNICAGGNFTLDLSGNTTGEGQTYQWQSSPDNAAWTNVSGVLSGPSYTTSHTASTYYRAAVQCNAGTVVYSTSVLVTSPVLVSGSFTINPAIPTGGTNFATFGEAISHINCGVNGPVVFNVAPGSMFTEQVTIPAIPGASSVNTIRFEGNLSTISFNSTNTNARAGITLNGADHIIIDSIIIDGVAGTYGWGIQLMNGADSNTISNSLISVNNTTSTTAYNHLGIVIGGTNTTPISASNAGSYNTIINNTIRGGYYAVIAYGNSTAPYPTDNKIIGNIIEDAYSYNIYLYGNINPVVSKNDISRPARSTSTTTGGVFVTTGVTGALIEKNSIHNLFGSLAANTSTSYGIYIGADGTSGSPNMVVNNLIYNIGGNGTSYGIYNTSGDWMRAYHNTISLDDQVATSGATYGIYQTTAATNLDYRNNIVVISRSGTGTKRAIWFNTTTSTITSNNNVLVMTSGGGASNMVGQYGTVNYATLADWKTANSNAFDQLSVDADPAFNNPGAGDYTPTVSAVNNIGANVGITTDILDSARSVTSPDPGAFEFSNLTTGINMRAEGLISPAVNGAGCYTATETVTIRIRNTSTSTHDFALNPVTVTVNVTGAVTQTLTHTINTGTLASDMTMDVVIPTTLNMTTPGVYTFNASTSLAGDANPANDAMTPANRTKVALTAGTAAGTSAFCVTSPVNPILSSTGYAGQTGLQWLSSTSASGGFAPIAGATSVPYTVSTAPTQTMHYRLVATCGTVTDSSAVVTVMYNDPQVTATTPASRCGTGTVTLGATGSAGTMLEWFTTPTGGTAIGTGTSFTTPSISSTTNYYVGASVSGGGNASPVLITEMNVNDPDALEIQNISPSPVDVTGWKVAVSNDYGNITAVNAIVKTLSGVLASGETMTWSDAAAATNYWGNNILWNPGAFPTFSGWAAILDNNNNLVDIVFLNWPASNIQSASITISGATITPSTKWTGAGIDITTVATGSSISRQGAMDNNTLSDFAIITSTVGTTNTGMTVPFNGFACNSARTMVTATVTPPASNAAGASGTTECATATIAGATDINFTDCDPIVVITPSGAAPVSGNIEACVTIDAAVQTAPTGEPYVQRHYKITPVANASTATSVITLYFLQSEFDAFNLANGFYGDLPTSNSDASGKANLRITQYNGTGTAPGNYTGTAVQIDPADGNIMWNSTASRWEVSFAATGSGGFYVHTGNFVLPVTGLELKGEQSGALNKLAWKTTTEMNNRGFELQRSIDGTHFSTIAFIGTKAENGNSVSAINYSYNDTKPFTASNYYRLKQLDKDGKFSYSNVVLLARKVSDITLSSVYPNPATRELNLVLNSPRVDKITIVVADLRGKVVMQRPSQLAIGQNQQQLDVTALAAGTYIIKVICADGCESAVHRFVKQ